ncbi:MFS transporter, NHS family, xanthosine permease [Dysgonomonas alginatilytica]|uniref:MFS transporter, NHS family, xanthosine permease n=1 Tax=Dysgonomonas alginatilytica TaxID=1605892 RepID=A0A2V3PNC4_9BACT|nr:nucleoside permease [Dysgonomonas alginatilytica]PXV63848.1 MFS transporter, NHS family, xanthosine permease [Dysgonomonas alginatilytica]
MSSSLNLKYRLIIMNFLQFFLWGTWLTSLGVYLSVTLHFNAVEIGGIFATMGISALIMPALLGIIADRFLNAERVYAICHLLGAALLFYLPHVTEYSQVYFIMLLVTMCYMPTLGLTNTIAYNAMERSNFDIVKHYPPVRVWGTVGFIVAMWMVDIMKWTASANQLYLGAAAALILGLYAFTLPKCPPTHATKNSSWVSTFGLDAFVLFKEKKMAIFFIFSMLLGAALQITNLFGQQFLNDFALTEEYKDSFAVQHPGILTSLSQISEALFILAIPFFMKRYGIKNVMLISMLAWVLRFALFGIGNPDSGIVFIMLSMVVYGMAFDFFNVSGSLFVETETNPSFRASAQGLFILMTNGIGTIVGTMGSGYVVDLFTSSDGIKDWPSIWFSFAAYALVLAVVFSIVFKYKKTEHIKTA